MTNDEGPATITSRRPFVIGHSVIRHSRAAGQSFLAPASDFGPSSQHGFSWAAVAVFAGPSAFGFAAASSAQQADRTFASPPQAGQAAAASPVQVAALCSGQPALSSSPATAVGAGTSGEVKVWYVTRP